jgi:predicted transcriptional regulator
MRSITLTLDSDWKTALRQAGNQFKNAWKTGEYQGEYIGFANPALLFEKITPQRWELLSLLQGNQEGMPLIDLATSTGREINVIESDIQALLALGLIEMKEDGKLLCLFEEIRAEFALRRVA